MVMTKMYQRAVELMEAELGDEIVALDVNGGTCFGFNNVASSVWRDLAEPKSLEMLCADLLDEYDVERDQCESEVGELLAHLIAKKLVRTTNVEPAQRGD